MPASPWGAARCGGSCWPGRCGGGGSAGGLRAPTRSPSPKARVVEFYTAPPSGSTVICADEPGLVIPRTLKAAVNLLVGRDWLTGPLGRKEHASQRSTTGLNELGRQYR